MGYTSLLEDITGKFLEVQSLIESRTGAIRKKIINGPIENSKTDQDYVSAKTDKSTTVSELEKLKRENKRLVQENELLQSEIRQKEIFLNELQHKIAAILEEHKKSKLLMEHDHQESLKKVTSEKAEAEIDYKSAILQIGSIVRQTNFHKKQDNINNIKLIVKKMTGL
jgi:hypothetical protein